MIYGFPDRRHDWPDFRCEECGVTHSPPAYYCPVCGDIFTEHDFLTRGGILCGHSLEEGAPAAVQVEPIPKVAT